MRKVRLNRLAITVAVIYQFGLPSASIAGPLEKGHSYRILFPEIHLSASDGERIEKIEVAMSCGQFRGVSVIPSDWSLEVVSPESMKTTLSAEAGHGSAALWDLHELNGSISVLIEEPSCFDITAVVVSATEEHTNRHQFSRAQITLKP